MNVNFQRILWPTRKPNEATDLYPTCLSCHSVLAAVTVTWMRTANEPVADAGMALGGCAAPAFLLACMLVRYEVVRLP